MSYATHEKMSRKIAKGCLIAGLAFLSANTAHAQSFKQKAGLATTIDYVKAAQNLSMRDIYARSLFMYMRSNPSKMEDPQFYINFLIYLMSQQEKFDCKNAFSSEFERRDFFIQSFKYKDQLVQAINSANITNRFDVPYVIDTGNYDFNNGILPFAGYTAMDQKNPLNSRISAKGKSTSPESCANNILKGTQADFRKFPWKFSVVDENQKRARFGLPFGDNLQVNAADARILFEKFGRQLYAIVGYQVRSANNGNPTIQMVATDGQLFGLSDDAVVRVNTYAHPTLSQPQYLDFTNPLKITVPDLKAKLNVQFQQKGFRAVGKGHRLSAGTEFSAGTKFAVSGSAAVGNSLFIMRLFTPQLDVQDRRLGQGNSAQRYLTIVGQVDFEKQTKYAAPVSGSLGVQQINQETGELESSRSRFSFTGKFLPEMAEAQEKAPEPAKAEKASVLDNFEAKPTGQ